jgi:pimeloyl-ACP methyl ester carboxylesterase
MSSFLRGKILSPAFDSLSKNYQVIAVSTRGHGKSELGTQSITYEQKANDVMAVINDVTKDSVIILVFSDGGYAGYKLASMYPERVKKLIAIGATELYPGLRDFTFTAKQAIALDTAYWKQQFTLMPEPNRLQEMFTKLGDMYNHLSLDKNFFQTIQCPVLVTAGDLDLSRADDLRGLGIRAALRRAGECRRCLAHRAGEARPRPGLPVRGADNECDDQRHRRPRDPGQLAVHEAAPRTARFETSMTSASITKFETMLEPP